MPTQILSMQAHGYYPFGQSQTGDTKQQSHSQLSSQSPQRKGLNEKIVVKQIINPDVWSQPITFSALIKIARLAKKVSGMTYMLIQIKKTLLFQQEAAIHLIFEYVPVKIQKYIKTMDEKFLRRYREELFELAEFLAQNHIITNIQLKNMGLNQDYELKYFLGLDFEQKKQVNIHELKNDYVEEIKMIFRPYIKSEQKLLGNINSPTAADKPNREISPPPNLYKNEYNQEQQQQQNQNTPIKYNSLAQQFSSQKYAGKNLVRLDKRLSDTQQMENISSRYLSKANSQNRNPAGGMSLMGSGSLRKRSKAKERKHESIYYEKSKGDFQIKQRKQSYMSSVSNLRLNNLYKRINEIELQVTNTKSPFKNQFKMAIQGREITSKSNYDSASTGNKMLNHSRRQELENGPNNEDYDDLQSHQSRKHRNSIAQSVSTLNNLSTFDPSNHHFHQQNGQMYSQQQIESQNYFNQMTPKIPHSSTQLDSSMHSQQFLHQKYGQKNQHNQFTGVSEKNNSNKNLVSMSASKALRISGGSTRVDGISAKMVANHTGYQKKNKKIQLFKQREYDEMKSVVVNTQNGCDSQSADYMKDFMNVLEESEMNDTLQQGTQRKANEEESPIIKNGKAQLVQTAGEVHKNPRKFTQANTHSSNFNNIHHPSDSPSPSQFELNPTTTSKSTIALDYKGYNKSPHKFSENYHMGKQHTTTTHFVTSPNAAVKESDMKLQSRIKDAILNSKKVIQQFKHKSSVPNGVKK